MSQPSRFGCLGVSLTLLLLISVFVNIILFATLGSKKGPQKKHTKEFEEIQTEEGSSGGKIAVIDLMGVIGYATPGQSGDSMVDDVLLQLRQAREDEAVKAIVLRIDSPGGEVNASDIIYNELRKTRDEFRKPIVTHMMSVAASGGYYAAMGTSKIVANELTLTGSIGVIMQSVQYDGLMEKVGLKVHTFKSGVFKDILSGDRPPTAEEMALVQELVMESYKKFLTIVSHERKLDQDKLRLTQADGRIFSGTQALAGKLIDQIGYYEDAIALARKMGGDEHASVIRYAPPFAFDRLFSILGESRAPMIRLPWDTAHLQLAPGRPYYLAPHLFSK